MDSLSVDNATSYQYLENSLEILEAFASASQLTEFGKDCMQLLDQRSLPEQIFLHQWPDLVFLFLMKRERNGTM